MKHLVLSGILAGFLPWTSQGASLDMSYYETEVFPLIGSLIPEDQVGINNSLPRYNQFSEGSQSLATPFEARVYFVTEGAGAGNLLGLTWDGSGSASGSGMTIFEDASIPIIQPMDFVDLGQFGPGTPLDFFLVVDANNYFGGGILGVVSTQSAANSDGAADHTIQLLRHVGSNGNTYLVYGFEDQPGLGDGDFNDLVITLELSPIPEPSSFALGMLGAAFLLGWVSRNRNRRITE